MEHIAIHTHKCQAAIVKATARAPATARALVMARVAMDRMLLLMERASLGMDKAVVDGTVLEKEDRIEMRVASKS